ncbi:hypothetical protein OIU78_016582 [Salix suchowensis]|nr:hypothetical protein OIU78_016582 [Salix suchowensis]
MVVRDAYDTMLMHLYSNTINRFKTSLEQSLNEGQEYLAAIHLCSQSCMLEFDQGCEDAAIQQSECNASKFREKLICYMLSEMMAEYKVAHLRQRFISPTALKVMVATVRCEEIAKEKLRQFTIDADWLALKGAVQAGPVSRFGATLSSILENYLSHNVCRKSLNTMLERLYSDALESFETSLEQLLNGGEGFVASALACARSCFLQFDKGCEDAFIRHSGWNASAVREKLGHHILSEMMAKYVKQVTDVLADEVQSLFEAGEADTWVSVRNLLASKIDVAESELSNAHVDFELPRSEIDTKLGYLKVYARSVVERKARESAATERVLMPMSFAINIYIDMNINIDHHTYLSI